MSYSLTHLICYTMFMRLTTPLIQIKGIGEATAKQLSSAGLDTVADILDFYPRAYEDYSTISKIADARPGRLTIKARAESVSTRHVRRGMCITTAVLQDDSGQLQAVWFNQPYRETQLKSGEEFYFSGQFEFKYKRYQLTNPSTERVSALPVQTDRILPIYSAVAGLKTSLVRKTLAQLRPFIVMHPETLPEDIVSHESIVSHGDALSGIHFPKTTTEISRAKERLAFEEVFELVLASQLNKNQNSKLKGYKMPFNQPVVKDFVNNLPYKLTNAQRRVAWDILQDLEKPTPMNRLLQGDVGSGKTVVAGLVARQVAEQDFQTAIMAPTEILANQHAETLSQLLQPFGVNIGLLTGGLKGKARQTLLDNIQDGSIGIVVGTHALIQSSVKFKKLGFVVIDEQHRFGVAQRQELMKKSPVMPHLLSMTATPIPRSLALTVYGDLDISVIDEKPSNRQTIKTKIWSPESRKDLYKIIDSQIDQGHQVYIVCPLIDNNSDNEAKSVEAEYIRLKDTVFSHRRIGLMHGKMPASDKDSVMKSFANGDLDILISTTVIEVGVDVPNATVMLIEDADKFGLAQLHQLRGRVGRSSYQSYCHLMLGDNRPPSARLREIERSNDGFHLAEVDLRLRGPGEIYGKMQHGELNLKIANITDTKLIARAKKAVDYFVDSGYDISDYPILESRVEKYQRITTLN